MAFTRYQLRRTIAPWRFEESIEEAVGFCQKHGIEEIIWKIDAEEISHGLPTLEMIRGYLPAIRASRVRLAEAGIRMSINPWVTQGMRDAGWDLRGTFPDFEWVTDITGISAKSQACPLSPAWREWLVGAYLEYASTGPRVLWVEDDFRVHRHRPVTVACFCQRHIRGFSERVGRPFTRESLAEELLKPGEPSPVRVQWLDYLGGVMCDVMELLAGRVYGQFPEVQLGLMCSDPRMHSTERRDWDRMMKAVRGPHGNVIVRPSMSNYFENSVRGLYESRSIVGATMKCIREPMQSCTELENYPFTEFSKSRRFTRAQVLLSTAMRSPSVTINAFDHMGTPLSQQPGWGELLQKARPVVDALAETFPPGGLERGVCMLHPENGSDFVQLAAGQKFPDLMLPAEYWAEALQAMGMSVTWGESKVAAVSGQRIRAYRRTLETLFSKGLILDLGAMQALVSMVGAARVRELTGVMLNGTFKRAERVNSVEAMTDAEFGGPSGADDPANAGRKDSPARHVTIDHIGLTTRIGDFTPQGARVISWQVNADLERMLPGFMVFENSLGGRVAVCPYDLTDVSYPWFVNWNRRRQMRAIVDWMFHGKTPLFVETGEGGAWAIPIRTDYASHVAVAVTNASLDAWEGVKLHLSLEQAPRSVRRLGAEGAWEDVAHRFDAGAGRLVIESEAVVGHADLAAFRIET
jgi:hypothetical protein